MYLPYLLAFLYCLSCQRYLAIQVCHLVQGDLCHLSVQEIQVSLDPPVVQVVQECQLSLFLLFHLLDLVIHQVPSCLGFQVFLVDLEIPSNHLCLQIPSLQAHPAFQVFQGLQFVHLDLYFLFAHFVLRVLENLLDLEDL